MRTHDSMSELDLTTLREYLSYDPATGVFTWIEKSAPKVVVGARAGSVSPIGYIQIQVLKHRYFAHRLAWFFVHGVMPTHNIDHINGDRGDNRIVNLRDVTQQVNVQNERNPRRGNPYLGVSKKRNKWVAAIRFDGRNKNLGHFDTPEEARDAYLAAKRKVHAGCTI
jgi:hypothetical protein